jgi:hypothetical protein
VASIKDPIGPGSWSSSAPRIRAQPRRKALTKRRRGATNTRVETGGRPRAVGFGNRWAKPAAHGRDPCPPRQGIRPLAAGRRFGDEVCPLQARSSARQPLREVASERHGRRAVAGGQRTATDDDPFPRTIPSGE